VQALLKRIEAAAKQKLVLPPGKSPCDEIPRYKRWLKQESHRLKIEHRGGADGLAVCRARAFVMDRLLQHLWDAAKNNLSTQAQKEFPALALVATGGYGRGELSPFSDIDFMFLHNRQVIASGAAHPYLGKMIDGVLYPLWDLGFKVGHSVRTPDECVRAADDDIQTRTAFIESRLIAGDQKLYDKYWATVLGKCVTGHEDQYIQSRLEDQTTRRAKYGNSACMQEPNVKNGAGGLRDYQNLLWIAFFKYRARSLEDVQAREFISAAERRELERAHDFLLRVRTEMHYLTNRATEVLSKAIQPSVATGLGFHERSSSRRIEHFMREVYRATRGILLITRTLERRMALLPKPAGRFSLSRWMPRSKANSGEPVDGFRFVNGEVVAASSRVFRDQPRRLMRVFLHAQQRGLELHPDLAQMIRHHLSLVDRGFRSDEHVSETFLTILSQRGNVSRSLRAMHEVDFLGKYLPVFGRLTCLVQHEFYHQYAADEHTLMCLEQADRIWEGTEPLHKNYTALFQSLNRPGLLYLALLLHDVGKADGSRGHSRSSAEAALAVADRLGLDGTSAHALRTVVDHHLQMAAISQRRDLDDPRVITQFANLVETPENLDLLTLLTFADAQATSDQLWNGFKDALLWTLYRKASRLLAGGTEFVEAEARQRERLQQELSARLPKGVDADELEAHFDKLPDHYYRARPRQEILEDLALAHEFITLQVSDRNPLAPVVASRHLKDQGCTLVKICTWDRAGLFNHVAGCLSAAGLNILSAQIFTRTDGIALDGFHIVDARRGGLAESANLEKFEKLLTRVLTVADVNLDEQIARLRSVQPPYQGYSGEPIQPEVRLDNEASENRTVIEVESEDRVGLLYRLSRAVTDLNLQIVAARICTEKGAAIDTFYVREHDGSKVTGEGRQHEVRQALERVAQGEPEKGHAGAG
jgi:[protein-PII] uridylyltransferase